MSHINFNIPWSLTNVWFSSRVRTTSFLWFDCSALKCHVCTLFDILDLVAKCLARPKPEQSEWWEQLPKPPSTWVSSGVMSSSILQLLTWSNVSGKDAKWCHQQAPGSMSSNFQQLPLQAVCSMWTQKVSSFVCKTIAAANKHRRACVRLTKTQLLLPASTSSQIPSCKGTGASDFSAVYLEKNISASTNGLK
jgi:hypothetical protein